MTGHWFKLRYCHSAANYICHALSQCCQLYIGCCLWATNYRLISGKVYYSERYRTSTSISEMTSIASKFGKHIIIWTKNLDTIGELNCVNWKQAGIYAWKCNYLWHCHSAAIYNIPKKAEPAWAPLLRVFREVPQAGEPLCNNCEWIAYLAWYMKAWKEAVCIILLLQGLLSVSLLKVPKYMAEWLQKRRCEVWYYSSSGPPSKIELTPCWKPASNICCLCFYM